ncbi:MAG: hypothetical protein CMH83_07680 [Nocardioides sp.]|nr:hypothetical protein [Nocardioides sp.]
MEPASRRTLAGLGHVVAVPGLFLTGLPVWLGPHLEFFGETADSGEFGHAAAGFGWLLLVSVVALGLGLLGLRPAPALWVLSGLLVVGEVLTLGYLLVAALLAPAPGAHEDHPVAVLGAVVDVVGTPTAWPALVLGVVGLVALVRARPARPIDADA